MFCNADRFSKLFALLYCIFLIVFWCSRCERQHVLIFTAARCVFMCHLGAADAPYTRTWPVVENKLPTQFFDEYSNCILVCWWCEVERSKNTNTNWSFGVITMLGIADRCFDTLRRGILLCYGDNVGRSALAGALHSQLVSYVYFQEIDCFHSVSLPAIAHKISSI